MIVPDLSKTVKPSRQDIEAPEPTPEPAPTGTTLLIPVNASGFGRKRRRNGRNDLFSVAFGSPRRSAPATSPAKRGLAERQNCASGLTYYACANGFTGCCQGNPCTQTAQCSVEGPTTGADSNSSTSQSRTSTAQSSRTGTATSNSSGTRTATGSATGTRSGTNSASITTANGTPSKTATSTGASTTISTTDAAPAPTCPGAPSNYTDKSGIAYEVKCNIDNSGAYNQTISVGVGGYAQCCSACSTSRDCAGFTFFGRNTTNTAAGTCYIRSSMAANEDFNSQSYVVALYKVDPSAVANGTNPTSSADASNNSTGGSNIGAIAGGVVGGVAGLVLVLVLLAFFIRRQRRKVDARRAAEKSSTLPTSIPRDGPALTAAERYQDRVGGSGHHRSGSTANDIYAPKGGFHASPDDYHDSTMMSKSADYRPELEGHSSTPPGVRAEGGRGMIPAAVLRPPQMLDSRAVGGNGSAAASRTSVFLEHMSEMEDTSHGRQTMSMTSPYSTKSGESPTHGHPPGSTTSLADEMRRRQHLLYWNNYDSGQLDDRDGGGQMSATMMPKTPPSAARTAPGTASISPDMSGGAHDSSFAVSSLNARKSGGGSSPSDRNLGPRRGTS